MYLFIVSERGDRTNICSNFEVYDLERFIEYINSQERVRSYFKQYRIAKLNDKNFDTRIFKYLSLEEFEEIFKDHIKDIQKILKYRDYDYPFFKKDIHVKYGRKVECLNEI